MLPKVRTHKDLRVWQESMLLAEMIYKMTAAFPQSERFGLTAQMRRAAVSVVSNIAEGAARYSTREFANFLSIARGSLAELETQLELASRLQLVADKVSIEERCNSCGRLLSGLSAVIRRDATYGRKATVGGD
jgi:four helix bundle protein